MTLDALAEQSGLTKRLSLEGRTRLVDGADRRVLKLASALSISVGELLGEAKSDELVHVVRAMERRPFRRAGTKAGYNYEATAAGRAVKAMEPFVMRPPRMFSMDAKLFERN